MKTLDLKKMVLAAMLIALSFLGSYIAVFGTIAFDSLPAYVGALLLGPWYGCAIGVIGHLFTALLKGLPLGLPTHLVIAAAMGITMICFSFTYSFLSNKVSLMRNYIATAFVGTLLNGPGAWALSYPLTAPIMGAEGASALLPILTVASLVNVTLAIFVFHFTKGPFGKSK